MPLNCEILPRPDAAAHQLKLLGNAIAGWFSEYADGLIAAGHDVDSWVDMDAIDSLLGGELNRWPISCGDRVLWWSSVVASPF